MPSRYRLAAALQRLRREATYAVLAKRLRVYPSTAYRAATGAQSIGLDLLDYFARVTGVEPWALLVEGCDPEDPPVRALRASEAREFDELRAQARAMQELAELMRRNSAR